MNSDTEAGRDWAAYPPVRQVSTGHVVRWIELGWRDFVSGAAWVGMTASLLGFFVDPDVSQPVAFLRYVLVQNELHFFLWAILGVASAQPTSSP